MADSKTPPKLEEFLINMRMIFYRVCEQPIAFVAILTVFLGLFSVPEATRSNRHASEDEFIFGKRSCFVAENLCNSGQVFQYFKVFHLATDKDSISMRLLQVVHGPIGLDHKHVKHFGEEERNSQIERDEHVEHQVEAEEGLEEIQGLVHFVFDVFFRENVVVLVEVLADPHPCSDLGHCSRESNHDEEIDGQVLVELGEDTADFERVRTLVENELGVDSRVGYHGVHIQ